MRIKCPTCEKQYALDPQRIPAEKKAIKCPACQGMIPLPPARPSVATPPGKILTIDCPCGKVYRIPHFKIRQGMKSVTCKACGETLALEIPKPQSSVPAETPPSEDEAPDIGELLSAWFTKKRIYMLSGSFVGLLLLIVILPPLMRGIGSLGRNVAHIVTEVTDNISDSWPERKNEAAVTPTSPTTLATPVDAVTPDANEPILALSLAPHLIQTTLMAFPGAAAVSETWQALDLKRVTLWLCPDADGNLLPALSLEANSAATLAALTTDGGFLAPYLQPNGSYFRLNEAAVLAALPADPNYHWDTLPLEHYRYMQMGSQILLAPQHLTEIVDRSPSFLTRCELALISAPMQHAQDLLSCSWRKSGGMNRDTLQLALGFAHALPHEIYDRIQNNLGCLVKIDQLAFSYGVDSDLKRHASCTHPWYSGDDSITIQNQVQQEKVRAGSQAPFLLLLADTACNHPEIERSWSFSTDQVKLDIQWTPEQDQPWLPLLKGLMGESAFQASESIGGCFLSALLCRTFTPEPDSVEHNIAQALVTLKFIRKQHLRDYGEDLASLYFVSRRGALQQFIPQSYAIADPANPGRYGYTLTPYQGYHIKTIPSQPYTEQSLQQWRRRSGKRFPWLDRRYKFLNVAQVPNLVAIPLDWHSPTIIYAADEEKLYLKRNAKEPVTHLPQDLSQGSGWVEINTQNIVPEAPPEESAAGSRVGPD